MSTPSRFTQRWLACTAGAAIATLGLLSGSAAEAASYKIDFNNDAAGNSIKVGDGNSSNGAGELIDDEWADWGVNVSGWNNRNGGSEAKLLLFNTEDYTGGDDDLRTGSSWGTTPQGNALIIQERSRNFHNPDDEARGGYIDFDFDNEVNFEGFSLLDIDDNGGGISVQGYDADNNQVLDISIDDLIALHKAENGGNAAAAQGKSVTLDGVTLTQEGSKWGNNSLFSFKVEDTLLTQVRVNYPGSGAITGLEFSDAEPPRVPEPSATAGVMLLGAVGLRRLRKRKLESQGKNV
ncbi:MAG: PEP-CTERM sorting domain-containing protein [Cyanobacteria bacterium J06635_1]